MEEYVRRDFPNNIFNADTMRDWIIEAEKLEFSRDEILLNIFDNVLLARYMADVAAVFDNN